MQEEDNELCGSFVFRLHLFDQNSPACPCPMDTPCGIAFPSFSYARFVAQRPFGVR
jgi:hypothetical protein